MEPAMHLKNNGLQDAARRKAILFCTVRGPDAGDILAKIVGEPNAPLASARREVCAVDANPAVAAARRQMQANFAIHVN